MQARKLGPRPRPQTQAGGGVRERKEQRMTAWRERASRIGAKLGNWNDKRLQPDTRAERTRVYIAIDALAGWLHVRPDRGKRA